MFMNMDVQICAERAPRPVPAEPFRQRIYECAFENAIEGIFQMSPDGRYLGANPALARIYGCATPEELQGRMSAPGANFYVKPERRDEFHRLMFEQGMVSGFESEIYRVDGTRIWISENAVPVRDELGRVVSYEGFVVDITDRRTVSVELDRTRGDLEASLRELRAVQAHASESERLRALGSMVNGIAHDFNNSLWMILGYSELLQQLCRKKAVAPEFVEYVDTIVNASLQAVDTITRLSDFQRQEALSNSRALIRIDEILEKAINFTRPRWEIEASGRGTPIDLDCDYGRVEPLIGSAADLCETFTHLILNAVEAMPQGGAITVQTSMSAGHVIVSIGDTGIGMTAEVQRRCLDPFFTTKGGSSSGVGLAVVHGTVERHGATMKIESAPGRGAKFIFAFPVARRNELPPEPRVQPERPLRILAVDDHPVQTELLARALAADRHTVRTAECGRDAIEYFDSETFDLVITDKAMPGMNGDQLAAAIKAREPGIPIIMLTGLGRLSDEDEDLSEFVDLLLAKPAKLEDLRAAISKVMN